MLNHGRDTEEASGGSLVGSVVCVGIVGTVFWVLGKAVDQIVGITNALITVIGLSQDAANTVFLLATVFAALPFAYLLAVLLNYMSTSADDSGGGV